jgi:hypothetical protein
MSKSKYASKKQDSKPDLIPTVEGIPKKLPKSKLMVGELKECEQWNKYGLYRVMMIYKEKLARLQEQEHLNHPPIPRFSTDSSDEDPDTIKANRELNAIGDRISELEAKILELEDEKEELLDEIEPLREMKEHLDALKDLL